jgi:hypothetical protein
MKKDWFLWLCSFALITLVLGLGFSKNSYAETNTVSSTVTGTTTVDKTPPSAISPSVVVNNSDICKTAVAGSVQTQVFGISSGVTVRDENCEAIKLSRALASLGLKVGAVSILAQNDARVFDSLWLAGTYPPINGKIGMEAKELWLKPENRHLIPEGSKVFSQIPIIEAKTEGVDDALFFKTLFILTTGLLIF